MLGLILKRTVHYTSYMLVFSLFLLAFAVNTASAFEVEIEYDPPSPEGLQEIEFKAVVKGAEAKSFLWDMGDGTKYKEQEFTHVYKRGGRTYDITLTVTDAAGKTVTKKMVIDILRRKGG
ncbi:MAG: PKD domain-containing protein [Thermodesulfovibrionales bacterium]|nr:PKD domain-containing protein [Thermodesulfovibrionales bacterium]